jgi:hypothetical protein
MEQVRQFVEGTFELTQGTITITAQTTCVDVSIPTEDLNTPIQAEYIAYLTSTSAPTQVYYANAGTCIRAANNRPIVGRVLWNEAYISPTIVTQAFGYQLHIRIGLHEMMHALGFTTTDFTYFPSTPVVTQGNRNFFNLARVRA